MKPCPETFPYPLIALDKTDSTNQYLSRLCNDLQEGIAELTTVTSEFQTAGKGQRGNTWEAEEGKNLLFSFVLYPTFLEARRQFILSQIVSLAIKEELFPLCTLITPNLSEATLLNEQNITTITEMEQAAQELSRRYHTSILIKGGHLSGNEMCDVLFNHFSLQNTASLSNCTFHTSPKIESTNLHGTGCTLSSAIATFLAYGHNLDEAVRRAKAYISTAISNGSNLRIGHGNGPLWHFSQ